MENGWLVVTGTMEFYDFPYIGNVIIPTYELRFFRGVGIPPTRWTMDEHGPSWIFYHLFIEHIEHVPG